MGKVIAPSHLVLCGVQADHCRQNIAHVINASDLRLKIPIKTEKQTDPQYIGEEQPIPTKNLQK